MTIYKKNFEWYKFILECSILKYFPPFLPLKNKILLIFTPLWACQTHQKSQTSTKLMPYGTRPYQNNNWQTSQLKPAQSISFPTIPKGASKLMSTTSVSFQWYFCTQCHIKTKQVKQNNHLVSKWIHLVN